MILEKYEEKDGIMVFHGEIDEDHIDYNSQGLDVLFQEEEKHFWFLARKEFIFQQIQKVVTLSSRIIEIGAGTGNVSRYLKLKGYTGIAVGEMHKSGLMYAKSYGVKECYQFNLLKAPFKDEFDAICLFDVLEHISDDKEALSNLVMMLKKNGHIVLTVPSHKWLWSYDDKIAGHKRRYIKKELISKLKMAGFEVVTARYFFISIVPLLLLRRFLKSDKSNSVVDEQEYSLDISINPRINKVLLYISKWENKMNKFLPNFFGGSLLVVARKL